MQVGWNLLIFLNIVEWTVSLNQKNSFKNSNVL